MYLPRISGLSERKHTERSCGFQGFSDFLERLHAGSTASPPQCLAERLDSSEHSNMYFPWGREEETWKEGKEGGRRDGGAEWRGNPTDIP